MKFFTKNLCLFILSTAFITSVGYGQEINLIPNISASDLGFYGNPIVYSSNLYFVYQNSSAKNQLAKYDGTKISLIANPSASDVGFSDNPIVFGKNLYFRYQNSAGNYQLAKYDGSTLSLIANPSASDVGFYGNPIVYGSNLYFQYTNSSGNNQLAKYDGTTLSLIDNPSTSDYGFQGNPIVYGSNLYFQYTNSSGKNQLAKYDGTTLSLIANPSASDLGFYGYPIVYGSNLYFQYYNSSGKYQLANYDGITVTLIDNPSALDHGFTGCPIVYGSNLYFVYKNSSGPMSTGPHKLAKYDGSTVTLIDNPSTSDGVFTANPIVYGSNLYFGYTYSSGKNQLAKYDGTTVTLIDNPSTSDGGFYGSLIIYGSNLYFQYYNSSLKNQLAKYDGTTVSLIANPSASDLGSQGYPIVYDNNLYFLYTNSTMNLAELINPTTWNGSSWDNGAPNASTDAIIASSITPGSFTCLNLTINNGAALTIGSGVTATVNGNITNSGNGISGTGNLIIATSGALSGNVISFNGMLTINSGATLTTNSLLTLSSNSTNSGNIAYGTGSYLNGNVTVQRDIGSSQQWRMIGFPFTSATTISESTLSGFFASGYLAYTYNEAADDGTNYGNSGAANAGWIGFTSGTISSSQGILINGGTPNSTINFTGPLNTGTTLIALTKSKNGWNLIANPFASNINWTTIAANNSSLVNNAIYRYDPNTTAYATYVSGSSTGNQSNVIENGAGFFVQATAAGNLSIAESDKTTSAPLASLMGIGTQRGTISPDGSDNTVTYSAANSIIKLSLSKVGDAYADEAVVRWGVDPATDNFDGKYDAYDMGRAVGPDLSVVGNDGTIYSIFHGSALQTKDKEQRVIALGVKNMEAGSYIINSKLLSAIYDGNEVYLLDHYTNQTALVSADSASYSFNVTADPSSASVSRFSIAFNYKVKLDIPANDIRLLNNPSNLNQFNIVLGADYQKLNWELLDNSGRMLQSGVFSGVTNGTVNIAQTNNLVSGTYFIKLTGDGRALTTQKWIKQ